MTDQTRRLLTFGGLFALMLAALACTCGPLSQVAGVQATVGAAQETLGAAATQVDQFAPTFEALASQAPELQLTATAAMGTAEALMTEMPGVVPGLPGGGTTGGQGTGFDGGDGYDTLQTLPIALNQPQTARLEDLLGAHNWLFEGTAGQQITIRVEGIGTTDPRVKLIDPTGNVLDEDDDSGGGANGWDALLTATLPVAGTYTLRVDIFSGGEYRITVQ
jgi:hypothetical protein